MNAQSAMDWTSDAPVTHGSTVPFPSHFMRLHRGNKEIIAKIVYFGPGVGGKTTNLIQIRDAVQTGEIVHVQDEEERTVFFDLLAVRAGSVKGHSMKIRLFTVPGQIRYHRTRRKVLEQVDGLVYVADSNPERMEANEVLLQQLHDFLPANGIDPTRLGNPEHPEYLPFVMQYNKRDLEDAVPLEELEERLNPMGVPAFQATAIEGKGVFETLKEAHDQVERALKRRLSGRGT